MPDKQIRYRAIAGDWWDATVLASRHNGTIDIEIGRCGLALTRVAVFNGSEADCPVGACMENPTDGDTCRESPRARVPRAQAKASKAR